MPKTPSVKRLLKPTSGKKDPDVFNMYNKIIPVKGVVMDKQISSIPWIDEGLLHNSFPINRT